MDYDYTLDTNSNTKQTEFFNPTTLRNNHFLHIWRIFSTSPFEQCAVFTSNTPAVTKIAISPAESTISAGQKLQLTANVTATGFANKSVTWSVTKGAEQGVTVNANGLVTIPSSFTPAEAAIEITATSVYTPTITSTASITVA